MQKIKGDFIMPNKYANYENQLKSFNAKYKVDFNFEKYDSQSLKNKNLVYPLKNSNNISKENLKYRNALLNIYKECVGNMVDNKYKTFNPKELAEEFEKLMNGYRKYCDDNGETAPDVNGGWEPLETMENMRSTLSSIPSQRVNNETKKYLSGELRLRDVRATVKKMAETGIRNLSVADLSDIMVYRASINNAIESRSIWWKIAHPFKNNAEQKAIKILDEVISINTANEIAAQTIVDGEAIDNANNSIERAINHIEVKPEARAYKKENMKLPFLSENANVKEVSQKIEPSQVNVKSNVKQ